MKTDQYPIVLEEFCDLVAAVINQTEPRLADKICRGQMGNSVTIRLKTWWIDSTRCWDNLSDESPRLFVEIRCRVGMKIEIHSLYLRRFAGALSYYLAPRMGRAFQK